MDSGTALGLNRVLFVIREREKERARSVAVGKWQHVNEWVSVT